MDSTKLPLRTWFLAVYLTADSKECHRFSPRDHWRIASCSNCTGNTSTSSASA